MQSEYNDHLHNDVITEIWLHQAPFNHPLSAYYMMNFNQTHESSHMKHKLPIPNMNIVSI